MIKTQLQPHQSEAVAQASRYRRFVLCMDVGTGKSLTALSLVSQTTLAAGGCAVVLCPKSAMVSWSGEAQKHTDLEVCCGSVSGQHRLSVVSFSKIRESVPALLELLSSRRVALIIDEAHVMKSSDSKQAKFLRLLVPKFDRVYALTATPMMNHIEDTYWLYTSMFPGIFQSFNWFMQRYTIREQRFVRVRGELKKYLEIVGYQNLGELAERIKPTMYRYSREYNVEFQFYPAGMGPRDEAAYAAAASGIVAGETKMRQLVARLPGLQQVVNSFDDKLGRACDLAGQIVRNGEACILFTYFLGSHSALLSRMRSVAGLPGRVFSLDGSTPLEERSDIVRQFREGDILVSTAAGGQSLNLQSANHVIFFDVPWSCGQFVQAVGRVARMNSKHGKKYVHIVGVRGTIDEYKQRLLSSNLDLIKRVMGGNDMYNEVSGETSKEALRELRKHLLWWGRGRKGTEHD